MDAGVHHQPHGAQHLVLITALQLIRVLEHSQLRPQALGIKAPAFGIGGVAAKALEGGELLILLRQADLEMMARRRFVQIEGLGAIIAARRQVIGVEIEDAGALPVGRAAVVTAGGVGLFAVRGHRLDLQRRFGNGAEQLAHHHINPFAHVAEGIAHRLRTGELEARIGAQMGEEGGTIALEAHAGLHIIHALQDARHLGKADGVDVIGRQIGGGAAGHQIPIQLWPTRHRGQAHAVPRHRQIFVLQEIAHPDQRRVHPIADHPGISGLQPGLIAGAEPFREFLHRLHHDRGIGAAGGQIVQLIDHIVHHQLGLHHAGLHALPEAQHRQIEQQRKLVTALQRILIILQRLERRRALTRLQLGKEVVEAKEMIDRARCRRGQQRRLQPGQIGLPLPLERVVTHLFVRRQRRAIDGRQRLQLILGRPLLGRVAGIGDHLTQFTRPAGITAEQQAKRIALQTVRIALRKQRRQPGRWTFGGGRARRRRRLGQRRGDGEQAGGNQQGRNAHGVTPRGFGGVLLP